MKENAFFRAPQPKERRISVHGRKWTRAESPIASFDELAAMIDGGYYIFVKGRNAGYHPSFISGWQFGYIRRLIRAGQLFPGVRSRHYPYTWHALWMHSRVPELESEFWVSCNEFNGLQVTSKDHAYILRRCIELTRKATGHDDARVHVVFQGEDQR